MNDLIHIREEIGSLDKEVIALLAKRKHLSLSVAQNKLCEPKEVRDRDRERSLLTDLVIEARNQGLEAHYITQLYQLILEHSVLSQNAYIQTMQNPQQEQQIASVAFLGAEGSYSHLAARRFLARNQQQLIPCTQQNFAQVIKAVEIGQAEYAVLPLENSCTGSINEVYDLLQHTSLSIIGELNLSVEHCLLAKEQATFAGIRTIYSHPQAILQCSSFLAKHPQIRIEYCESTATAMQQVKELNRSDVAAIGNIEGAMLYDLHKLKSTIANHKENFTRFVLAARKSIKVAQQIPAKTTLILSTPQKSGSLVEVLLILRDRNINMSKLESRPVPGTPWEELFYLDVEANLTQEEMQSALDEMTRITRYIKVLGCYPSATIRPIELSSATMQTRMVHKSNRPSHNDKTIEEKQPSPSSKAPLHSRQYKKQDTLITLGNIDIGGNSFITMAGPCSVESKEQIFSTAATVKEYGGHILRGGCFKPRTNPYSFQGMGYEGLAHMRDAGNHYQLPIITEVMSSEDVREVAPQADILQIGARNMQNFSLLKEVGKTPRPILLKRGLMASLDELLGAAEYILAQGNQQVMLCERGIRTFETATRNTLDLSAVPLLKQMSHLPVIIDPSHAVGRRELVLPMVKAAKAVGAHGIIVEVHPEPEKALSDAEQQLNFAEYQQMMQEIYG